MWTDRLYNLLKNCKKGKVSAGLKNLNSGDEFKFNEEEIFPAASIIKIPVMVAFFQELEKKTLNGQQKVKILEKDIVKGAGILFELHRGIELTLMDLVRLMIVISDNSATNILISMIGFEKINHLIKASGMKVTCLRRKMMLPYKDSEENLISVEDINIFLEKLFRQELLSEKYTNLSIDILKRQQYREKIPLYIPDNIEIAHKTGEISGVRHDSAIVFHSKTPYILSVFTKDFNEELEADRIIAQISKIIYDKFSGDI